MSREEMRKLMEAASGNPLAKYGVKPGEHITVEDGWVEIELDHEIDWGSIQDVDSVLSEADPEQRMYRDYTAMGDDVPNAMAFNIQYLDKIAAILEQEGEDLQEVFWWAGPSTYSEEGEAAYNREMGYDDEDEEDDWD